MLTEENKRYVHLPNSLSIIILYVGKYSWNGADVLKDVLVVPKLKYDDVCVTIDKTIAMLNQTFCRVLFISGPLHWESKGDL